MTSQKVRGGGGQVKAGQLYLPFVPQHVVFAEVGVDQVALLIQLLHHLHGKTARSCCQTSSQTQNETEFNPDRDVCRRKE